MNLRIRIYIVLMVYGLVAMSCQSDENRIPEGQEVELNNILSESEWQKSKVIAVNDSLRIRVHQTEHHIFLAADFDHLNLDQYRWVEFYISDGTKAYRFHASGQLGEQYLKPPYWTENWDWGNNELWTATTQRLSGSERKSSSNQAYEFRFDKKKFKTDSLKLLFHGYTISTQAEFSDTPLRYYHPAQADRYKVETWVTLRY